jgi:hypothetical protein
MGNQHVVDTGTTWKIRCAGKYPVQWVHPTDENKNSNVPPLSERASVTTEKVEGDSPRPHLAYLEVENVQYTDTDNYYCRYVGTKTTDVPQNVTHTYLFARDETYLLDGATRFQFFNVPQYRESVIPCRPTDPEVTMTFTKGGKDITKELDTKFFKYDPKRGLVITTGTMSFHTGHLVCTGHRGGLTEDFNAIMQFQNMQQPPPPSILKQGCCPVYKNLITKSPFSNDMFCKTSVCFPVSNL